MNQVLVLLFYSLIVATSLIASKSNVYEWAVEAGNCFAKCQPNYELLISELELQRLSTILSKWAGNVEFCLVKWAEILEISI